MRYKLKILKKLLSEMTKKREEVVYDLNNDPTSQLIELHLEFNDWLKDTKGEERTSKESMQFVNDLVKKQEQQEERKKTYDSNKLIEELVKIDSELQELNNQIYSLESREKR
tara:strand:+ start:1386 stop:1721 length:336 start_codon:yes stop_codon:yes gene_type:complete